MVRGITLMKCTECGKRFLAPDIELCATVYSQPSKCPKCSSIRTMQPRFVSPSGSNKFYGKVGNGWKVKEFSNPIFHEQE